MSNTQKIFGVTGWKNSGKTTLVCRLVEELTARGYKISTIKHAHQTFDIDHEGRDSHRHRISGAQEVAVISSTRWAIVHELREEPEPPLQEILAKLTPVDLVVVEGFKREPHPKIEARRQGARQHTPLADEDSSIVAIASDSEMASDLPAFDLDDIPAMADFVESFCELKQRQKEEA